jgi:hypothetical protein
MPTRSAICDSDTGRGGRRTLVAKEQKLEPLPSPGLDSVLKVQQMG